MPFYQNGVMEHLMKTISFRKYFKRIALATIWMLEIFTLVICEKKTNASETYNAAQKVSETYADDESKKIVQEKMIIESTDDNSDDSTVSKVEHTIADPIYGMSFFSINSFQLNNELMISDERKNDTCFFVDADAKNLLSVNTILEGNIKLNDRMTALLGKEDTWDYLLGQYIYLFDRNYTWSYQIFGAYPIKMDELKNINNANREKFNIYFDTLFLKKENSYHLDMDLKKQVLEDWHIISIYMPYSNEDGYVIQATLRSMTSL